MPRPLFSAALAFVAAVIVTSLTLDPAPARAAEPEVGAFVEAAEAIGLVCDADGFRWYCAKNVEQGVFIEVTVLDTDAEFRGVASQSWTELLEVRSVDAEYMSHLAELVAVALGDDPEAQNWLISMNDGTTVEREFRSDDWTLTWTMATERVATGDNSYYMPRVELDLRYFPPDLPASLPPASLPGGTQPSEAEAAIVDATEPPAAAPIDPAAGLGRPSAPFADAVPTVAEVSTDPIVFLQSAALAALLVFLMPFPSQLFNSTLETHEDEVKRWLRLDRLGSAVAGIGAVWGSWPGVIGFTLLAALLYGFLDPGFGISLASLATFLGMLVGIVLVTAAFAVPVVLAHRRLGDRWSLKVVPVSLLIGVACVVLSRLTGFQPGYLYGLLIGLAFARELSAAEEGRATAIGAVVMLAVAFVAWLGLGAIPEGEGFGLVVLRTSLAALMVAGLEGVVFGLLPMRFLPGEPLYAWNRILWGGLLAVGAFAFFHILINPASGYLSDSSRTPLFTVVALLGGFSLVSVAFWAWFRFHKAPLAETEQGA